MPELPEVETILRALAPRVGGRRIRDAQFSSPLVLRADAAAMAACLRGRAIEELRRHGKFLVLELDGGLALVIHFGMTGKLLWQGTPGPHTRAVFTLDGGRLVYDDIRQFGRIELSPARLARLGPDALAIGEAEFAARLKARHARVKPLLLNQAFLRGLGNIYADEALFRARIHPRAIASRLAPGRVRRLHAAIRQVLEEAIAGGGSSISDYVDSDGRRGTFQERHRVYGRAGEPCPVCGGAIRRIVVAQRGTHYCPKCQRA